MSRSWTKGRATVPMNRAVRAVLELAFSGRQSDYVIEHGGRRLKTARDGFKNAVERAAKICPSLGRWVARKTKGAKRVFVTDVTRTSSGHGAHVARGAKPAGPQRRYHQEGLHPATPEVLQDAVDRLNDALQGGNVALPARAKQANAVPSAAPEIGSILSICPDWTNAKLAAASCGSVKFLELPGECGREDSNLHALRR